MVDLWPYLLDLNSILNFPIFSSSQGCAVTQSSYSFKSTLCPHTAGRTVLEWTVQHCPIEMFQDISVRFISSEHKVPLAAPLHEVSTLSLCHSEWLRLDGTVTETWFAFMSVLLDSKHCLSSPPNKGRAMKTTVSYQVHNGDWEQLEQLSHHTPALGTQGWGVPAITHRAWALQSTRGVKGT